MLNHVPLKCRYQNKKKVTKQALSTLGRVYFRVQDQRNSKNEQFLITRWLACMILHPLGLMGGGYISLQNQSNSILSNLILEVKFWIQRVYARVHVQDMKKWSINFSPKSWGSLLKIILLNLRAQSRTNLQAWIESWVVWTQPLI